MKENSTTPGRKTIDAGERISQNYFAELQSGFAELFPGVKSVFIIEKALIEGVLSLSDEVSGIRFMYGLKDKLNPNSLVIMLVPCTHFSDHDTAKPIVNQDGFFDHEGNRISIPLASELLSNFVLFANEHITDKDYKEITRGNFFGSNTLDTIMGRSGCTAMRFNMGYGFQDGDYGLHPMLEPLNADMENFWEEIFEKGTSCPPRCGFEWKETFAASLPAGKMPSDEIIDIFRNFRDNELLKLEGGAKYYEMYYFITPFISAIVSRNDLSVVDFYHSRFLPFSEMIRHGLNEEAMELLKDTLDGLVSEFAMELKSSGI